MVKKRVDIISAREKEERNMITQIADRISTFLFHGKIINSKDREKCRYGLEIMISTCIGFSVILLAGSILGKVQMALVYLICIVPLRMYTGGYHAETYLKCNFVFAVIFLLNIIVFDFIISHALQRELLMITFFSIFPINRYAPVENSNKKISITQKKKYKKISILMYG